MQEVISTPLIVENESCHYIVEGNRLSSAQLFVPTDSQIILVYRISTYFNLAKGYYTYIYMLLNIILRINS